MRTYFGVTIERNPRRAYLAPGWRPTWTAELGSATLGADTLQGLKRLIKQRLGK